jgi:HEAT repeat protein
MRVNRIVLVTALLTFAAALVNAQVPVVGGKGSRLSDIAGTDTLVTVVLKGSDAMDANLKIVKVSDTLLSVEAESGRTSHYLLSDIREIRVQGSVLTVKRLDPLGDRAMTPEQQQVVNRAMERVNEIFDAASGNQPLRMWAAEVLAVAGSEEQKQTALEYLTALATGNDLRTALDAAHHLVLAGSPPATGELITQGLDSGDRQVRASAARLAGLTQDPSGKAQLHQMLRDRASDISVPAINALAWLEDRDIIPTLLTLITERNEDKANAAANALIALGGDDIVEQMKLKLPDAQGRARFRVVRVLDALGDPLGRKLLREEMMAVPSLQFESAIILARQGDAEAMQILRQRLSQRYDPYQEVLTNRAQATAALIEAGDRTNISVFQELLRIGMPEINFLVLRLIGLLELRSLLPVTQPVIESADPQVAVAACQAAAALARSDYRVRLAKLNR